MDWNLSQILSLNISGCVRQRGSTDDQHSTHFSVLNFKSLHPGPFVVSQMSHLPSFISQFDFICQSISSRQPLLITSLVIKVKHRFSYFSQTWMFLASMGLAQLLSSVELQMIHFGKDERELHFSFLHIRNSSFLSLYRLNSSSDNWLTWPKKVFFFYIFFTFSCK